MTVSAEAAPSLGAAVFVSSVLKTPALASAFLGITDTSDYDGMVEGLIKLVYNKPDAIRRANNILNAVATQRIYQLARKYTRNRADEDEFVSIGYQALFTAAQTYENTDKSKPFIAWAHTIIRNEMLHEAKRKYRIRKNEVSENEGNEDGTGETDDFIGIDNLFWENDVYISDTNQAEIIKTVRDLLNNKDNLFNEDELAVFTAMYGMVEGSDHAYKRNVAKELKWSRPTVHKVIKSIIAKLEAMPEIQGIFSGALSLPTGRQQQQKGIDKQGVKKVIDLFSKLLGQETRDNKAVISDKVLENLAAKFGKDNEFYKFIEKHRDFIEKKPIIETDTLNYFKQELGIENLQQDGSIETPIGKQIISHTRYDHILNHEKDKKRKEFIPEMIATLRRPNLIVKEKDGKGYNFLKVFYDEKFNPHLVVVSKDGNVITQYPLGQNTKDFTERLLGEVIYDEIEPSARQSIIAHDNTLSTDNVNIQTPAVRIKSKREFNLTQAILALRNKYAPNVRISEDSSALSRKQLGYYRDSTKNIFVKSINDLRSIIHELTHAIDFKYRFSNLLTAHTPNPIDDFFNIKSDGEVFANYLMQIYFDEYAGAFSGASQETQLLEGFATLLEMAIVNPSKIVANQNYQAALGKGKKHYFLTFGATS